MRSLKLASLLLLAGTVTMACSSDGTDGGDGDGDSGVGAAPGTGGSVAGTGGGTPGTGSMTGDGDGDGTGGMTANTGCTNTVVATGMPTMIDDFELPDGFPNFPDDADGRVGTWEHESWNPAGGDRLFADPELVEGAMHFSCDGGVDEAWCGTPWVPAHKWSQWADTGTRFTTYSETDVNCYDASAFTGIKFKAKSAMGTKIQVKLVDPATSTPQASIDGWAFKSDVITLTDAYETYEVPFASIIVPTWVTDGGGPAGAVPTNSLISMAFVIRSVEPKSEEGVDGEELQPYDVTIDDVEFY